MLDKTRKPLFRQLGTKKSCFFFRKMSHNAEKRERGTFLDLLAYNPLQNIKKLKEASFEDIKKIEKKSHNGEKIGRTLQPRPVL